MAHGSGRYILAALLLAGIGFAGVCRADYVLPDEGLPQMQPGGQEARPDEPSAEQTLIDAILEEDQTRDALLQWPRATRSYYDGSFDTVRVRELDDPANPWAEQYSEYDRWLHDHYFPYRKGEPAFSELPRELLALAESEADDWVSIEVEVDKAGFMLPCRVTWERRQPALRGATISEIVTRSRLQGERYERLWLMPSAGVMPGDLRARMDHDRALHLAPLYPPIPQWLGLEAPDYVLFTPGGEVLCGQRWDKSEPLHMTPVLDDMWTSMLIGDWQRYSSDGTALGPLGPQRQGLLAGLQRQHRQSVEFDTYTFEELPGLPPDERQLRTQYWQVRMRREPDPASGRFLYSPLFATDLLGTPVDIDAPLPPCAASYFWATEGALIEQIYQAQLELGLTSGSGGPDGC